MPKLNPNEAPEGYIAVKAKGPASNFCDSCAFRFDNFGAGCMRCLPKDRSDGCNVIFKKDEKPKRKPREWMAWAYTDTHEKNPIVATGRRVARELAKLTLGKVIRVKITEVI